MEFHEKAEVEQFAVSMCEYIFLKLGVLNCDFHQIIEEKGFFTEAVGKTVLYHRMLMKDCLMSFFTCNFNRIVADIGSIAYEFCSRIYAFSSRTSFSQQFFRLSACVIELFIYCRESSICEVELSRAPRIWITIFELVLRNEFYQQGGWYQITMHANLYCEKLSPYCESLIENIKDPYEYLPDVRDLPKEFAHTSREVYEALHTSYSESTLRFIETIPPPIVLRKHNTEDDGAEYESSRLSPPPKKLKRVHQVFDYV